MGNTWSVTDSTTFGVNDPNGSMTTHGTYTAGQVGEWQVRGTYTGVSATATVTVTPGTATSLDITPKNAFVWVLDSVTYSAVASDSCGNTWTVTGATTFDVSDSDSFGTINKNVYTAGEKGTHTITGTYNTVIGTTTVISKVRPDLWVIKVGDEEVRQGDPITYNICYGNAGCSQAASVTLRDILPTGVSYASSTLGTPGISGSGTIKSPYILTWNNIGPLESQDERYATITVNVGSTTVGSLTNVLEIEMPAPSTEVNLEYNRSTWTTVANPRMIDLAISKLSVPDVLQGATLSYRIIYSNLGNIEAANVILTDYLPQGVTYINNTLGTPTLSNSNKTITWSISSISAQTQKEFELIVRVDSNPGNITNVVSIHGTKTEANLSNNQASCVTAVKPSKVDLSIEKTGPAITKTSSQIRYLITYQNKSNVTATNVVITDILPFGTTYGTSSIGQPQGTSTLTWSIGSLASQAQGSFDLTINVGNVTGTLTNVIKIASTQADSNPANNQSTVTTMVTLPVDLKILKNGPTEAKLNTNIPYTIQYQKLSGGDTIKATITDTLPRDTKFVSSTLGTPTTIEGNRYSWQVTVSGSATQFATITVFIPGTLTIGTSLTNHVAIIPQDDSNWADNFATWTCKTDESITDLELFKYGSWQIVPGGKIVYSFWLNNIGETDITAGTITDYLPIGLTWVDNSNQSTVGTPTITERERQTVTAGTDTVIGIGYDLVWTIDRILPAGSCTMVEVLLDVCPQILLYSTTHMASPTAGYHNQYIINKIRVETKPDDNNKENNADDFITQIITGKADVYAGKRGPYESCPGQTIKYHIYGGNCGYSDAGNVTLRDTMPIGVTLESIEYIGGIRIGSPTMTTITYKNWKQGVLTWNLGTISANSGNYSTAFSNIVKPCWFSFIVKGKISDDILPTGHTSINLDNFIEIKTTSPEEGAFSNSMNFKTIVVPRQVDLVVYKNGPKECPPNSEIIYKISYYNNGPDTAHTVTITDTLPPGVKYGTDNSGLKLTIDGQKLTWTVGTLGDISNDSWYNNYKTFNLTVKAGTLSIDTKLTNKIEISSKDKEKSPENNKSEFVTTIKCPTVNLVINKSGPNEIIRGTDDDIWYSIWFSNDGNTTAKDVTIVDTLPSGASYKKYYGSYYNHLYNLYQLIGTPTVSATNQIVTWKLGDLAPNSSGWISLLITANFDNYPASKSVYNKVTISSSQPDSNPNNNYKDFSSHIVNPVTNLHVIKHGPKKVCPGQEMIYTIHYGNAGNIAARDIEIVDTLPKGVTYMSSEIDYKYPPQVIGDKVIWRIPKIRHGFNTNFDVKTLVSGSLSTNVLVNKVEITVLPTDHNPKNNVSEWKTKVIVEKADVSVTIIGNTARPGFKKKLYVTCSNEGTGKAENVVLTLELPDKKYINYDCTYPEGVYNSSLNTITWNVGSLSPGKNRSYQAKIEVKTSAPRGTRLYSQAVVTTSSQESDTANNKAREHEEVIGSYDPNIKTASPQDYVPATATAITYTIMFENMATATANATMIEIDDPLSDKLDWNTVAIGDVCIGGTVYTISEFNAQLRTRLKDKLDPLIPSQFTQEEVDEILAMSGLSVWWHPSEGTITWKLNFGDYEFGLPPNNPLGEGTGWVRFTADTIGTLSSGIEIANKATIKFDYNEPMDTPIVKHIVDGVAPCSMVTVSPYQTANTFTVSWEGTDTIGQIAGYDIYVQENTGTFTKWASFAENSAEYVGIVGHTYTFYCKAMDMAGNIGEASSAAMTRILSVNEAGIGTLTQVIINPVSANMEIGQTMTITAQGINENSEAMMLGINYQWSVPEGLEIIGSTSNSRTVKAISIGTMSVLVTAVKDTATATTTGTYTISAGAIDRITVTGSVTTMELKQEAMFTGHAFNKSGAEIAGQTFAWEVNDAAIGSITVSGSTSTCATITALITGSGWVIASAAGKQGSLQILVNEGNVATVTVDGPDTMQLGQSATFTAIAYNQFGYELLNKTATWEIAPEQYCGFTPQDACSARLTAYAPGVGTLTGNINEVHKACAITIIQGTATKLAIISSTQTIPAGMASADIIVQAQNEYNSPVDITSPMTITVTSDSLMSRFSPFVSGSTWGGTATYVIPTGTSSARFLYKYNGTTTAAITIMVNADNMTAATQTITVTALGTATAGDIVADDGKTSVTLTAGDLINDGFIEIDTNPTPDPGGSVPVNWKRMAQTLRKIEIIGTNLSPGATVTVTIPYLDVNLAGNPEDSLQLYQLGSRSTTWEKISSISRDTINNTVSCVVGSFSYFSLMMPDWPDNLKNVIVYPNPCITDKYGYQLNFANLTQSSTVKIFNIAGELVKEIRANNQIEIWKLDNDDGQRIASGIYIYLITDPVGNKKVGKLAVVK
ncbi:MAG: T9SS type A sorting domain-containing protein [bacterium]|nr:T9SS type A sorting domain-containing protein [bacterium]